MRSFGFATLAAALALVPATAASAGDSDAEQARWGDVPVAQIKAPSGHRARPGKHRGPRWGHRVKGRWHAGWGAPGGWGGYRFAGRGYQLPTYWIAPRYVIAWQPYGLPAPLPGHSWSRYYDDAVMIDAQGRVHDSRRDIEWDRYEGGYDEDHGADYPPPRHDGPYYPKDYRYDEVTGGHSGVWEGTWQGQYDGKPYKFVGSFDGEYRRAGADYPSPGPHGGPPPYPDGPPQYHHPTGPHHAPGHNPAIQHHGSSVIINGMAYPAGGHVANGFYYPPPTITTITVSSGCCPHAEPSAVWKPKAKPKWKPRPKARPRSKIIRIK